MESKAPRFQSGLFFFWVFINPKETSACQFKTPIFTPPSDLFDITAQWLGRLARGEHSQ